MSGKLHEAKGNKNILKQYLCELTGVDCCHLADAKFIKQLRPLLAQENDQGVTHMTQFIIDSFACHDFGGPVSAWKFLLHCIYSKDVQLREILHCARDLSSRVLVIYNSCIRLHGELDQYTYTQLHLAAATGGFRLPKLPRTNDTLSLSQFWKLFSSHVAEHGSIPMQAKMLTTWG